MNEKTIGRIALAAALVTALCVLSCSKENKKAVVNDAQEIPLSEVEDIEKKYLDEGFISPDLYRVVIVMTKDESPAVPDAVLNKAKKRAQVSLERAMNASGTPADRNMRAEILSIIDQNGSISKKDIEHRRYSVYYFDIARRNLKNFMKSLSSGR